uniref:Uncharacterized protein n=1 Tax=Lepeophtheirus salmonis TaxID=72036 RepID=A0A0K2V3Z8_LEPSM
MTMSGLRSVKTVTARKISKVTQGFSNTKELSFKCRVPPVCRDQSSTKEP